MEKTRAYYLIKERIYKVILYLLCVGLGIIFLLPFIWLVSTSFKTNSQIFVFPPQWIPNPVVWKNYIMAVTRIPFFLYFKNTLIIVISSVIGIALSSSIVAYGFSRIEFPGREVFFFIVLSTMMIPFPVTMIPLYIMFRRIGWLNTYNTLIIPCFFGAPFFIFLLRQFFRTIPRDLSDAAKIDGCSEFGIYAKIILPLSKPALAVTIIFQFLWTWNDFLGPLIYLYDQEKYTLALGLRLFQSAHQVEWSYLMAASTLFILPTIILFFFTQRFFVEGINLTGMKL